MKKVLVPLDGTRVSEEALAFLHHVCAQDDTIVLLSVQKPVDPIQTGSLPGHLIEEADLYPVVTPDVALTEPGEQTIARQVDEAKGYLEGLAGPLREAGFKVSTEVRINEHADRAIVQFARDFQPTFITLSRSTRLQPAERLFGSVTTRIVESNVAPIMLVPQFREGALTPWTSAESLLCQSN
jgi:nucleotide-binding universal stress UspA family protein